MPITVSVVYEKLIIVVPADFNTISCCDKTASAKTLYTLLSVLLIPAPNV